MQYIQKKADPNNRISLFLDTFVGLNTGQTCDTIQYFKQTATSQTRT